MEREDLVGGVLGIDALEEFNVDLVVLVAGLALENKGGVG